MITRIVSSIFLRWDRIVLMRETESNRTKPSEKSRHKSDVLEQLKWENKSTRSPIFHEYQGVKEFHMLARIGCFKNYGFQSF